MTWSGLSALRIVLGSAPEASSSLARRWTSRRWIRESRAPPSGGGRGAEVSAHTRAGPRACTARRSSYGSHRLRSRRRTPLRPREASAACRRGEHPSPRLRLSASAPATSLSEAAERLRDLPLADRVVRRDAIARTAVAAFAVSRGARARVANFNPLGHQLLRATLARAAARSNQRSSSASATRIRRPRRTTRSSPMTCSSK
jgi:hypothetical protein